jgi:hypothetical protein
MSKGSYIDDIIEYFKELKSLWQSKHRETIDEKIHSNTKNFSTINIIMTFLLISLTMTSIFLTGLNSASQDTSELVSALTKNDVSNVTEEYKALQLNFTLAQIEFKATSIQATYGMIKIMLYGFSFVLIVLFLFNILSAFVEYGYHKRIKKWDEDLITFEEIITFLYTLKIKFSERIKKDEIKNKLFLFSRLDFVDYKNIVSQVLGKLENELTNDESKN